VDQISRIGMDTSKHIFQLHGVNAAEVPVLRKKLRPYARDAKQDRGFYPRRSALCGALPLTGRPQDCNDDNADRLRPAFAEASSHRGVLTYGARELGPAEGMN